MDCCDVCKIFGPKLGSPICCPLCQKSKGAYHDRSCPRQPCRASRSGRPGGKRGCGSCAAKARRARINKGTGGNGGVTGSK